MAKQKAPKSAPEGKKIIALNRRARHEYHVIETITAGMVLTGTEVKSIRAGKVTIVEAFARIEKLEVLLYSCQISPYEQGNIHNHEPLRVRKLLLSKRDIRRLHSQIKEKGLTLIPLSLFFERQWVKLELGLCKGKQLHDKRADIAKRDSDRQIDRAMRQSFK